MIKNHEFEKLQEELIKLHCVDLNFDDRLEGKCSSEIEKLQNLAEIVLSEVQDEFREAQKAENLEKAEKLFSECEKMGCLQKYLPHQERIEKQLRREIATQKSNFVKRCSSLLLNEQYLELAKLLHNSKHLSYGSHEEIKQ